jgi:hypothetical protein
MLQVRIAETQTERENKLFVGMLPKTATEQDLTSMFSVYGVLREVHVIRGPEGGSKGCAFVKFHEKESAILAIQDLHDTIPMVCCFFLEEVITFKQLLQGATRPLVVKFADNKKQSKQQRGDDEVQLAQHFSSMNLGGMQQPSDHNHMSGGKYPFPPNTGLDQSRMLFSYPGQQPHQQPNAHVPSHPHQQTAALTYPVLQQSFAYQQPFQERYFVPSPVAAPRVQFVTPHGGYLQQAPSSLYHRRDDGPPRVLGGLRRPDANEKASDDYGSAGREGDEDPAPSDGPAALDTPGQHIRPPEGVLQQSRHASP